MKVELDTPDKPEVIGISARLRINRKTFPDLGVGGS